MSRSFNQFGKLHIIVVCLFLTVQLHASNSWPQKSVSTSVSYAKIYGESRFSFNAEFVWHNNKLHHGIRTGLMGEHFTSFEREFIAGKAGPELGYFFMTDKGNHHFEINPVALFLPLWHYGDEDFMVGPPFEIILLNQLGYRYQKPEGKFFIKFFVGKFNVGMGAGYRLRSK